MDRETLKRLDGAAHKEVLVTTLEEAIIIPDDGGESRIGLAPITRSAMLTRPIITEEEAEELGVTPEEFPNTVIMRRKP